MAPRRTIKLIKQKDRPRAVDGKGSLKKTANQLRREMVLTVANWIAETREELEVQRRLCQQFRRSTIEGVVTETGSEAS